MTFQQNIGRVNHVALVYPRDKMESVIEQLTDTLGIEHWDGPVDAPQFGVAVAIAIDAGVEIVSPLSDDSPAAEHLRQHGEGLYTFCFGVGDLESAASRASDAGAGTRRPGGGVINSLEANDGRPFFDGWENKFRVARTYWLGPVGGVPIVLGEYVPR